MLESMTGSSRTKAKVGGTEFHFFLKSINQRALEVHYRLPSVLSPLEEDFSRLIARHIPRGRVEVSVDLGAAGGGFREPIVDEALLGRYRKLVFAGVSREEAMRGDPALELRMLQLPGVLSFHEAIPDGFPAGDLMAAFEKAVQKLGESRLREGRRIEKLFVGYLKMIEKENRAVEIRFRKGRKEREEAFLASVEPFRGPAGSPDRDRLLSAFLEWYDKQSIDEERERLSMHIAEVRSIMESGEEPGRRIEFFAQEMLREANTMGAKSRDFEIRKSVVEIKTIIEKIKEQVRNLC